MNDILEFQGEHRWLSNFWLVNIHYENITYPSVEHAYQAAKTLDVEQQKTIALLPTPGKAKRAGRRVIMRDDWDKIKVYTMAYLLHIKFQHAGLRKRLIETGDCLIVEGNRWNDQFWGMCNGHGQNILGQLIMAVRETIKISGGIK
jgi:ribA/ribD-fused uncharacterized protein